MGVDPLNADEPGWICNPSNPGSCGHCRVYAGETANGTASGDSKYHDLVTIDCVNDGTDPRVNLSGIIDILNSFFLKPTRLEVNCGTSRLPMHYLEMLLRQTQFWTSVNISGCNLEYIPSNTFEHLNNLEILDLSSNRLNFLKLNLSSNNKIHFLDLSDNKLVGIAFDTVDQLNERGKYLTVRMRGNNFYCCNWVENGVSFESWMRTTSVVVENKDVVNCLQNNGKVVSWRIANDCNEPIKQTRQSPAFGVVTTLLLLIIIVMLGIILWLVLRKKYRKFQRREQLAIREGSRIS